jgi:hypothetical protein
MEKVIWLSLVTASVSFMVAEAKLFSTLRERANRASALLGKLLSCGYCFGHWVAFALVALYRPRLFDLWWQLDYFLTAMVIAWLGAFQVFLMCLLMDKTESKGSDTPGESDGVM